MQKNVREYIFINLIQYKKIHYIYIYMKNINIYKLLDIYSIHNSFLHIVMCIYIYVYIYINIYIYICICYISCIYIYIYIYMYLSFIHKPIYIYIPLFIQTKKGMSISTHQPLLCYACLTHVVFW